MPYIGKEPARVPVTAADIPDDSITAAKIVDGVITAADIGANAVGNSEMADDAVGIAELSATGTASNTTFLRGDNSWVTPTDTNTTYSVQDGQLSQNNFTDADHTKLNGIAASANNYVHPNHSGEVTSTADGAQVIADNVVDEANLKISNSPTNGQFLSAQSGNTGGLTWATVDTSTLLPLSGGTLTNTLTVQNNVSSNTDPSLILSGSSNASQDSYIQMGAMFTSNPLAMGMDNSSNTFKICRNSSGNISSGEHVVINSSGNVGIGQATPSSANIVPTFLHIGDSSTSQSSIILEDDESKWEIAHNGDIAFRIGGTAHFRIGSDQIQNGTGVYKINALTTASTVAGWNFDSSGASTISCAQNTAIKIGNMTSSGMILVNDTSVTGQVGLFVTGGAGFSVVGQTNNLYVTSSSPSSSQVGLYQAGGYVYIKNGMASNLAASIMTFRTRSAQ